MREPDFNHFAQKDNGELKELKELIAEIAKAPTTWEAINLRARAQEVEKEYQEELMKQQLGIDENDPVFESEKNKSGSVVVEKEDEEREEDER